MPNNMTTTQNGFRVEDITFRGARKQSEIDKEKPSDTSNTGSSVIPVSLTPEQVIQFYNRKISETHNSREQEVYNKTIQWISDCESLRKKVASLEIKLEVKERISTEDEMTEI